MSRDDSIPDVGKALETYLKQKGLKKRITAASVVVDWADLVGPQIAKVTVPRSISADGTLFVEVSSAAWMQELHMMEPTILRQLSERGREIRRIVWRASG